MSQYDGKTIAEIVHDYAVTRGDLSEQYARDQLVEVIERRIASERAAAMREAADEITPESQFEPSCEADIGWFDGRMDAVRNLRDRANHEEQR